MELRQARVVSKSVRLNDFVARASMVGFSGPLGVHGVQAQGDHGHGPELLK